MKTDHLGSPRAVTDAEGEVIARRDFMPFGEDLGAGVGPRTENLKYSAFGTDRVRQRFTGYEKDGETGLDFAEARMYQNRHGRFTAPDPLLASASAANPQTFNRYIYTGNNPANITDPSGLLQILICDVTYVWINERRVPLMSCSNLEMASRSGPYLGGGAGGGRGGGARPEGGSAPPLNSPTESVNDCKKRERLKCEQIGRDYFNANAPTDVVKAILGVPALLTTAGGTVAAGRQLTFREFVKIIRPLLGKAGPYGAVFAGLWALYDITQHAVALENECKRHIEEKCRR